MRKVKKIFDGIFVVEFSGGIFGMLCRALREFLDMWGRGEIVKHLFDLGIIKFLAKPFVGVILLVIGFVWLWFQNQNPETEAKILDERGSPFERPKHPVLKLAATGLVFGAMMTVGVVLYAYFHSRVVTAAAPVRKAATSIAEKHETAEIPKHKNRPYSAHKDLSSGHRASTNSPQVPPAASSDQYYAQLACALGAGICNLAPGSAMVGNTIVGMDRGIVNGGASTAIYSNFIQGTKNSAAENPRATEQFIAEVHGYQIKAWNLLPKKDQVRNLKRQRDVEKQIRAAEGDPQKVSPLLQQLLEIGITKQVGGPDLGTR